MSRFRTAVQTCSLVALLAAVGAAPMTVASPALADSATPGRLAGADRYETAVEVAREVGGGSLSGLDRLIVVSGETFPDALTASGLAGYLDAGGRTGRTAILLTRSGSVPPVIEAAVRDSRVPASDMFVVGGPSAVSDSVRDALAGIAGWDGSGANPITRISGANRYETAEAIADYVHQLAGGSLAESYRTVLVASGADFPDALSAGILAYRNGHLLLLSDPSTLPTATQRAVQRLDAGRAVLIGGPAALTPQVDADITATLISSGGASAGPTTQRLGGADRYETAAIVARQFITNNGFSSRVMLASGADFPDSLTVAPLTASNQPLLLTATTQLPAATSTWLTERQSASIITVIGGPDAISPAVVDAVDATIPTLPPVPTPAPAPSPTLAPNPTPSSTWAVAVDATTLGDGRDVVGLADGSSIITGQVLGTVTLGATTLTPPFYGAFVAKIDADGQWLWATGSQGGGYVLPNAVSAWADGSAIITGDFSGTAIFGATTLTSSDNNDVFVAKIDAAGSWVWATQAGNPASTVNDEASSVAALADGSAIVSGTFQGTAAFGAVNLTSAGDRDVFVAKIDAGGSWVWATQAGGTGLDRGEGMAALTDGSAIVTGQFSGTATVGATTLTSAGGWHAFVAKIDAAGSWLWAAQADGPSYDAGRAVSVFADGTAIITGYLQGTATIGATTLTSAGGEDVFVAKVDATGSWLWAARAGGTGNNVGHDVAALADGTAIITGHVQDAATFGATTLTSAGGDDIFVAKVDATGSWLWATRAGSTGRDVSNSVAAAADSTAIITGLFSGTATFGTTTLTGTGDDIFVAKVGAN